ncbi:hypothetical protein SUGI_0608620 [Cryptomeria japonica]|nr:hypothetical protein SUGI_0608620 [Cryptomeria japonica]
MMVPSASEVVYDQLHKNCVAFGIKLVLETKTGYPAHVGVWNVSSKAIIGSYLLLNLFLDVDDKQVIADVFNFIEEWGFTI